MSTVCNFIARRWTGTVAIEKLQDYLRLMRDVAIPDYLATPGNLGAWCLHQVEGSVALVTMLSFWRDESSIIRFAGDRFLEAKYYDFDDDYLLAKPKHVVHIPGFGACADLVGGASDTHTHKAARRG